MPTQTFKLTPGIDTFTATRKGAIFNALPFVQSSGLANNTLNTGDNLQDSHKDGTLNYTAIANGVAANPPFALGVTLNGIATANISNQAAAIVAGFQGNVTGLTTVNDNASVFGVQLGGLGQGLNTALTNVNISGYGGPNSNAVPVFNGIIATAAGSLTNTINIRITGRLGATATGGADALQFAADSGPGTAADPNLSYGTWAITTANNVDLQLQQGGVGAATALTLSGAGNIAVGQDAIGNWQNLKTIDASGETGTVVVTGATSGVASQAFATTGNPGWLFGSNAGLLDDTGTGGVFDLTSFKLGSGTTFLDVSSASVAQVAALTTTPGTHVALNNEIIVNDTVATTTSATTFGNIAGFEILGVAGAGGIINDAHLAGAGIDEILYQTAASGALTITNQTSALTVNTEDNGLGFAIKSTGAGLTDSFTLDLGNPLHNTAVPGSGAGSVGALTLTADSIVNINALGHTAGGAVITDTLGFVSLTPSLIGNEQVTISGTTNLTIGVFGAGGIQDVNAGGALITNNMIITDTDTGVVTLHASGGALFFAVPGDTATGSGPGGTLLTNSDNAAEINATNSGGIILQGGDANYTTSLTVAGSVGDIFLGSTTAGDVFGGSIGNDTFTLNQGTAAETIYTSGGADTINLFAGHTAGDVIGFYAGFETALPAPGILPGGVETPRANSITDSYDAPQLGWWGQATGATATGYSAGGANYAGLIGNGTGTSADATVVNNYNPGVDLLVFAASSGVTPFYGPVWNSDGANGLGGTALGLVDGAFASFAGHVAATVQQVTTGGTVNAATDFIELTGHEFGSVNDVATQLENGTYNLSFSGTLASNNSAHLLLAWEDFSGETHISDLAIAATAGATKTSTGTSIHVSDIVELPATSLIGLTPAQVHFA